MSVEKTSVSEWFQLQGHPIHTRCLEVTVNQPERGRVQAQGRILDLRKFGFVPTGGDLQSAGVIHDMSIQAEVSMENRVIERFEPLQQVVPFEASSRTEGESCRDSIHRLRGLVGASLDTSLSKNLSRAYGGALGCSHLLTLSHLLSTTLTRALDWEADARRQRPGAREANERLFKRSVLIDGFDLEAGQGMEITVQLGDLLTEPYSIADGSLSRFARHHEVRGHARIDMGQMSLASLGLWERERVGLPLQPDGWVDRGALVAPLVGGPAIRGLAHRVDEHIGLGSERSALRDTLRNLAPGAIQCMAAYAHRVVEGAGGAAALGDGPSILQFGGLPDSCYIWREGGPGMRSRSESS
ncbi:MAG: DUF2889 domain-containing protein [Myxococcota bacterium]|nr:DUF2889 domain-containing protein [Myxococcota bacterium]